MVYNVPWTASALRGFRGLLRFRALLRAPHTLFASLGTKFDSRGHRGGARRASQEPACVACQDSMIGV